MNVWELIINTVDHPTKLPSWYAASSSPVIEMHVVNFAVHHAHLNPLKFNVTLIETQYYLESLKLKRTKFHGKMWLGLTTTWLTSGIGTYYKGHWHRSNNFQDVNWNYRGDYNPEKKVDFAKRYIWGTKKCDEDLAKAATEMNKKAYDERVNREWEDLFSGRSEPQNRRKGYEFFDLIHKKASPCKHASKPKPSFKNKDLSEVMKAHARRNNKR